ncbi:MAG: hypothetical protein LQ337_006426 [Flavoplaca oasis]|nr:MAG: hypothetical protein LQ337_006426 [Flavoplaca oasis]
MVPLLIEQIGGPGVSVHGLPASENADIAGTGNRNGTLDNPIGGIIEPPEGFTTSISRAGHGKPLFLTNLYSATLHALLHFCLLSYEANAETYTTRGPEPPGTVVATILPFITAPLFRALNCHVAWGLYWSIIAFNNPANVRESAVATFTGGRRNAIIRYLQVSPAPASFNDRLDNTTTSLSYGSALQMLQTQDQGQRTSATLVQDDVGYQLKWLLVSGGEVLRRETVYDTIAYAMLWTAQYTEDMRFIGLRSISVPGGRVYVRLESYQVGRWVPMTYGFAATVLKTIPSYLEANAKFEEAFFQVLTPDSKVCGSVGIFIRSHMDDLQTTEPPDPGRVQTS